MNRSFRILTFVIMLFVLVAGSIGVFLLSPIWGSLAVFATTYILAEFPYKKWFNNRN